MDKINQNQNAPLTGDAVNGTIIDEAAENAANAQEATATESGRPIDLTEQLKPEEKKIPLINLGPLQKPEIVELKINDAVIKVKRRIPYEEVLGMIQWCIDFIVGDKPFLSAPIEKIIRDFAILKFYTNIDISFLDNFHELKDIYESYDLAETYDIISKVSAELDVDQIEFFDTTLHKTLESIVVYRNSAKGIIDTIADSARTDTAVMEKAMKAFDMDPKMQETLKAVLAASSTDFNKQ